MRINFIEVKTTRTKRWKDPETGKPRQKTRTFSQTINPFNKNSDGKIKTREDILKEIHAEADEWMGVEKQLKERAKLDADENG